MLVIGDHHPILEMENNRYFKQTAKLYFSALEKSTFKV